MTTATKSKKYYATRAVVRVIVKILLLLIAYATLHVAASSVWNALLLAAVIGCGFLIYDHKTKQPVQK